MEKANIFFAKEKKTEKEKERNIFFFEEKKTKKLKEEDIWRRKICFCGGEEKQGTKRRKIFGTGKYFFAQEKKNRERTK